MIGMESLEATTNGRGLDHNPLTGPLPFLMLMGDVALLSVTLLAHGTIGRFHCGIVGKGLSHESAARHRPVRPLALKRAQLCLRTRISSTASPRSSAPC